jgi:putative phosphoesterase
MKICIVSDSHDNRAMLATAVSDARDHGAELVLHCGDVIAPTTLRGLPPIGLPVHVIHGNNIGDHMAMFHVMKKFPDIIHYHGMDASLQIGGRKIFMVHYPHYARAMALTGDYDMVCCGHDHRFIVEQIENIKGGQTTLVNPGTVGGIGKPATYMIGDLDNMEFTERFVPADRLVIQNTDPVTPHS